MDFNETEKIELLTTLKGIEAALTQLNTTLKSVIEPSVTLRHFKKGAAIRIDDTQASINNKTF